jgi:hypothetical protein
MKKQARSKSPSSRLTGSAEKRSERLLRHIDIIDGHRHRAETFAVLLDQCYAMRTAGRGGGERRRDLIHAELEKMREAMSALYREAMKP